MTQDEAWQRVYGLLAKHGFSFDLQAYPGQFPGVARLVERHPEVQVVINHTGMAIPAEWEEWRSGMKALAALPHVTTKLSGMGFTHRPWSIDQARPYLLEAIELFGADRAMFASDFPTDKLFGSFAQHLDAYDEIVAGFAEDERRALFARNANRTYRLGLDV